MIGLMFVVLLFMNVKALSRIETQLAEIAKPSDDSAHDALHPVFSTRQVRLARQRFENHYTTQLRLEKQLYDSEAWLKREERTELSPNLCKDMRHICEKIVEAESSWKEYVFMVSGNVSVSNVTESGRSIIERWSNLLK